MPTRPRPPYAFHTERSVGAEQEGRFLVGVFDEWVLRDVAKVLVGTFR